MSKRYFPSVESLPGDEFDHGQLFVVVLENLFNLLLLAGVVRNQQQLQLLGEGILLLLGSLKSFLKVLVAFTHLDEGIGVFLDDLADFSLDDL